MKKLFVLIIIFAVGEILAQSSPSGYTSNYGLRLYSQGATPGADSLNQNWTDIDDAVYSVYSAAALKASSNTFSGIQTFNGANFSNGSHGTVTFSDSVLFNYGRIDAISTATFWINSIRPKTSTSGSIGSLSYPEVYVYSKNFIIPNSGGTDSAYISFDDANINLSKNLTFTDSTKSIGADGYGNQIQSINTDSVISPNTYIYISGGFGTEVPRTFTKFTYTEVDTELVITHALTAAQTGIIVPSGADTIIQVINMGSKRDGYGSRITIFNASPTYNYTIQNGTNIYTRTGGDVKLSQYQSIDLIEARNSSDGQIWIQPQ